MEYLCSHKDENGAVSEVHLFDTSKDDDAIYYVTTMDHMDIETITFDNSVRYNTYSDKTVGFTYGMNLTEGFTLTYSLEKQNENGTFSPVAGVGNDEIMKALGYEQVNGQWGRYSSNGTFIPLSYTSTMSETFDLGPGNGIFEPGNTYKLTVTATDGNGTQVGTSAGIFTWPALSGTEFYVKTVPTEDKLQIYWDPVDSNKVIVDGVYYMVLWDANGTIKYFQKYNAEETVTQPVNIEELASSTAYTLAFYAQKDMNNDGTETALELTSPRLENMTEAERNSYLLKETEEMTMQSWGGRYDDIQYSITAQGNICIDFFNAYGLGQIDQVLVSVYHQSTSTPCSFEVTKTGTGSLFTDMGSNDYRLTVNSSASITGTGTYTITCTFMQNGERLFPAVSQNTRK